MKEKHSFKRLRSLSKPILTHSADLEHTNAEVIFIIKIQTLLCVMRGISAFSFRLRITVN
jgi:hypothetical protein